MGRTVPTIVDPPGGDKFVSFSFIDASGDQKAVSFEVSDAATSVQIEAFVAAVAAASNANIWEARITQRLTSPAKPQMRCLPPFPVCMIRLLFMRRML